MQFYIKDNYYFDIDLQNQLRISGPENHLFLGLSFPKETVISIKEYYLSRGNLVIELQIDSDNLHIPIPVVTDIRTLRAHTEQVHPRPSYGELIQKDIADLLPTAIRRSLKGETPWIQFTTLFTGDDGSKKRYGSALSVKNARVFDIQNNMLAIEATAPINMMIRTVTNIKIKDRLRKKIFSSNYSLPHELFSPGLIDIYNQSQVYVEHLIRAKKTSSFEYGTIFPRDWIESADLGLGDLSQDTVDYMYSQSLRHVSDTGEAWHEDVIGSFQNKLDKEKHIDRKMIDIEPRYIMGMKLVSKAFLTNHDVQQKLQLIAKFILKNAQNEDLISFKKQADSSEYHKVGNWRDSYAAYPSQKSPLSPYDVNCVFYPVSLRVIREFNQFFGIGDLSELNDLIEKWSAQKNKFQLNHSSSSIGYSLALHGEKHLPLPIAHLDESYDMFYGSPSLEEIVSFADKIIDPNFFYTPVGPLLVDIDHSSFTTGEYHGKVIWPKQAAYCVAGLSRQFRRGLKEGWPWPMIEKIKAAVLTTAEACFKGWEELGCVPELYYYDEQQQRARFYTDQEKYEGQMSLIQLWSSVGCRRIMQEYASVRKIAEAV
ncbi:MAG: hypothetical protein M3Q81_02880 [bacterium]|nr:hypothetical protein [bacterium]